MLGAGRLPLAHSGVVGLGESVLALAPGDDLVVERSGADTPRERTLRVGSEELVVELGR